jgi:hypothetical protein
MQKRTHLALIALVLMASGLEGSASPSAPSGYVGEFRWHMKDRLFGGFSSMEIAPDGTHFTVVTDRGGYTTGEFQRDAQGAITAINAEPVQLLQGRDGQPLGPDMTDSEGLAISPDGTSYISFEGPARVLRYASLQGPGTQLPVPPDFRSFPGNTALEALAIDRKGALYTMPEELRSSKRMRLLYGQPGNPNGKDFPIYRFADGKWSQPFALPRRGAFLPVGADFGPDGRLYILERQFRGIAGFGSRVRSFAVTSGALRDERQEVQTNVGQFDNLEGLSVWRDASGAIRLTMVSDNNFLPIQQTEFVEYRLAR